MENTRHDKSMVVTATELKQNLGKHLSTLSASKPT